MFCNCTLNYKWNYFRLNEFLTLLVKAIVWRMKELFFDNDIETNFERILYINLFKAEFGLEFDVQTQAFHVTKKLHYRHSFCTVKRSDCMHFQSFKFTYMRVRNDGVVTNDVWFDTPSVRLSICPSTRLYVCLSVRLSVYPCVCLSICPSVRLSVRLFVCLSVCPSVRLCVCPYVRMSVCLSVRLSRTFFSVTDKGIISKLISNTMVYCPLK